MKIAFIRHFLFLTLATIFIMVMTPENLFASSVTAASPMSNSLCIAASWITGTVGRGIATIGVVIVGIWKLLGKISGRTALVGCAAIAVMFGASQLVALLGGTPSAVGGISYTTTNCT